MSKLWVIGGTSGIGQAIFDKARREDWTVDVSGTHFDVRNLDHLQEFYSNGGPYDAVVYSAGINRLDFIPQIEEHELMGIFNVNVFGFVRLLQVLTFGQESGKVLAVSSDAAVRPMRTSLAYCASKAALNMAVQVAARELAPEWQINAIAPGMTEPTEMTRYIDARVPHLRGWQAGYARQYEQQQIPMGRRAHVSEVADLAIALLNAPGYMTGAIVPVNGGR